MIGGTEDERLKRAEAYARKTSEYVDQGLFIVSTASSGYTGQPRERARCLARRQIAGATMHAGAAFLESGPDSQGAAPEETIPERTFPRETLPIEIWWAQQRVQARGCSPAELVRECAPSCTMISVWHEKEPCASVQLVISQKFLARSPGGHLSSRTWCGSTLPETGWQFHWAGSGVGARSRSAASVYSSRQGTMVRPDAASSLEVHPSAASDAKA